MTILRIRKALTPVSLAIVIASIFIVAALPAESPAQADDDRRPSGVSKDIPVTRWPEESELRPTTYKEWKNRQAPLMPFRAVSIAANSPAKNAPQSGKFVILVNEYLRSDIQASLDQYMVDLVLDGYEVELIASSGGTHQELRAFLTGKYLDGMEGVILVGDFPIAWYEITCWDWVEHEEFPCDLYYMDMDGIWEDGDGDGKYDSHYGETNTEIWFGRLTASPMHLNGADEATLINNYFHKNHLYRTGQLSVTNRALLYIDDDWEYSYEHWSNNIGMVYPDRTVVYDPYETVAIDYQNHLSYNYEMIQLHAHSDPVTHYFSTPSGSGGTLSVGTMINVDPRAIFYNLFACSNARFVETDYMAGWYVFTENYGLGSVGSTKTGSMQMFYYFYSPFSSGKTFGQAFSDWFSAVIYQDMWPEDICWYYGMTLCGDPTLKPGLSSSPSVIFHDLFDIVGDADGVPEQGETVEFRVVLHNQGGLTAEGVTLGLAVNDASITVTKDSAWVGDIGPGNYGTNDSDPLIFEVPVDYISRIDSLYISVKWNDGFCNDTVAIEQVIGRADILLVDDDNDASIENYYSEYLANSFVPFDLWRTADSSIISGDMDKYDIVVWFTGGYRADLLNSADRSAITGYLDNGGNLFISGQGLAEQLSVSAPSFLNNYLKSEYVSTSYVPLIIDIPGGQIFDFTDSLCITGAGGPTYQTNPDQIASINGSITELEYLTGSGGAAVSFQGLNRLVYFSFGLETALNNNPRWQCRDSVYSEILDFFQLVLPSVGPRVDQINVTPGDPLCLLDKTPDIAWTYSDEGGSPQTMYHLQVGADNFWGFAEMWDCGPVASSDNVVTYDGLPLQQGKGYYIRVRAFNGTFWSGWNTTTIHTNGVPVPTGLTPSNHQQLDNTSPELTHDVMTDPEGSPLTYSYELYDDASLTELLSEAADQPPGIGETMSWTLPLVLSLGEDYYWRVRTTDTMEVGQWSPVASFLIISPYICGDSNGDGELNVGDAVYMINYVFKGGPGPDPLCAGDANGDSEPNVGDAVYLISYIFKGGPPPVSDCCQ